MWMLEAIAEESSEWPGPELMLIFGIVLLAIGVAGAASYVFAVFSEYFERAKRTQDK